MAAESASLSIDLDTAASVRALKRLERASRQAARALAELAEVWRDPTVHAALADQGIRVITQSIPAESPQEG